MGQGQLQRVGTGLYRLLEKILLWDVQDPRTPTRIPLALLRLKPFRGYLRMAHPCCSHTKMCTYKKSFKKLFGVRLTGTKNTPGQAFHVNGLQICICDG